MSDVSYSITHSGVNQSVYFRRSFSIDKVTYESLNFILYACAHSETTSSEYDLHILHVSIIHRE